MADGEDDWRARMEIADLVARYSRAVDRRDFALLASLYAPGATQDHGAMFRGTAEQFVAWVKASMGDMVTQHLVGNMLVRVFGDEAEGEVYTINHHMIGGDAPHRYTAAGRYLDVYRKVAGRWLFASRLRVIDWSESRPVAPAAQAGGVACGSPGANDPAYRHLPRLARAL